MNDAQTPGQVQQGEVQAAIDLLRDAYMHAGGCLDPADGFYIGGDKINKRKTYK